MPGATPSSDLGRPGSSTTASHVYCQRRDAMPIPLPVVDSLRVHTIHCVCKRVQHQHTRRDVRRRVQLRPQRRDAIPLPLPALHALRMCRGDTIRRGSRGCARRLDDDAPPRSADDGRAAARDTDAAPLVQRRAGVADFILPHQHGHTRWRVQSTTLLNRSPPQDPFSVSPRTGP